MFLARVIVSFFEFFFSAVVSVLVVYVMYRVFIIANEDYDGEGEIEKGNVAVAVLAAAILYAASGIVQHGLNSVTRLVLLYMTTPVHTRSAWELALMGLSHLVVSFFLAVFTISFSLRFFGRLCSRMHLGNELKRGNVAVGVLLSGVIIVVSMFVGQGVSSLSKALLPQPSIGKIQVMR